MLKIIEKGTVCIVTFEDMNSKERELYQQIKALDEKENAVKYQQFSIADMDMPKNSVASYKQPEHPVESKKESSTEPAAETLSLDDEPPFETPKTQKKGKPLHFIGASMQKSYEQEQKAIENKKKMEEVQEYLDCPFLDINESKKIVKERYGYDAEKQRFLDEMERD